MHRFYLTPEASRSGDLLLEGAEAKHAVQVLRLQSGETVEILNGVGERIEARVDAASKSQVRLTVLRRSRVAPLPYRLTLLQAIPKGKTMDSIVQKATELGTHRIVPILSERTEVHLDEERGEGKTDKWRVAVIEAMKQCGCPWMPQIDPPCRLDRFLKSRERFDLTLVGSLESDARHPRLIMSDYRRTNGRPPVNIAIWIGPEGDFSPAEYAAIKMAESQPMSLGPFVLRCDTAATASLACIHFELQFLTGPNRLLESLK